MADTTIEQAIAISDHARSAENTLRPEIQAKEAEATIILSARNPNAAAIALDFLREPDAFDYTASDPNAARGRIQQTIDTLQQEKNVVKGLAKRTVATADLVVIPEIAEAAKRSVDPLLTEGERHKAADRTLTLVAASPEDLVQSASLLLDVATGSTANAKKVIDDDLEKVRAVLKSHLSNPQKHDETVLVSSKGTSGPTSHQGKQGVISH